MKIFILKSTVLTIIIFALGAIAYSTLFKQFYLSVLPFLVLFFYLVTNFIHAYLLEGAGKSNSTFPAKYMAASFLKMFLYLVVAIVYVFLNRENAKSFLVNILVLYVLFTGFEVYEISKIVRKSSR